MAEPAPGGGPAGPGPTSGRAATASSAARAGTRLEVGGAGGMVSSSHRLVSETGAAVLAAGGSAGDAVLAMAAMSFVALPGQCGVGGDAFCVWYEARSGRYRSAQGSGTGPDGSDVAFFARRGLDAVPLKGALAVAVPGAPAAMATLHASLGTRPLAELWGPAVAAARDGLAVSEKTRADIEASAGALAADAASSAVFLPGGNLPGVGTGLRQGDLATTLEQLAADPASFYAGDLAERSLRALREAGAPFSGREWAATAAPATDTVQGRYGAYVVHENLPPSPGYMVLQQAAVLDGVLGELPWLSPAAVGWLVGAAASAFADRRRLVGSDTDAWQELLAPEAAAAARRRVAQGLVPAGGPVEPGDTTSMVAVDAEGNAVSYIHSLAFTFGAAFMVPGTGVTLNDRLGRGAYLRPHHPNGLLPGRRPMHTLNAWIAAAATGRPALVGNTPGGDGQVQWNMQLLSHLVDHRTGPQRATEAPRFTVFPGSDADAQGAETEVRCESRLDAEVVAGLRKAGWSVALQGPWEGGGSAQVLAIDAVTGERRGGSDPRFDGCALGA